jgi:hypothetical protein
MIFFTSLRLAQNLLLISQFFRLVVILFKDINLIIGPLRNLVKIKVSQRKNKQITEA